MTRQSGGLLILVLAAAVCAAPADAVRRGRGHLQITSSAFRAHTVIPRKYTADGDDVSPPLDWTASPTGIKSFAIIVDDPDAPPGIWVHWTIWNLPGTSKGVAENQPRAADLPNGARQGRVWGVSTFSRTGYWGPEPPPGRPHRYSFRVYALDMLLDLPATADAKQLVDAMGGHILAQGELIGLYGRH